MSAPPPRRLLLSACAIDLDAGVVHRDDAEIPLTSRELDLLTYLVDRAGLVVSTDELLEHVWGYRKGLSTRAFANTISRLRAKVEEDRKHPVHVVTLYGRGVCFRPPEAPPVPATRATNASTSGGRFVGRVALLRTLDDAATPGSLTTLRGPGGVGKTRLARELLDRHPNGLFCDLSPAHSALDLLLAVGAVLGVPLSGDSLAHNQRRLGRALRARGPVLLVLDNVEQLLAAAASAVAEWRELAPQAALLVTSRHALELDGERVFDPGGLPERPAIDLLIARSPRPGWTPSPAEEDALGALARTLDGLPLALELAAARLGQMSVDQLTARLGRRFSILRRADGAARHQSLAAAVGWSLELIAPQERAALAQLAVFAGPFSLPAAEAVVTLTAPDAWVGDVLDTLVAASLLHLEHPVIGDQTVPHYRVLRAIRPFVGDPSPADHARHLVWARVQARTLAHDMRGSLARAARANAALIEPDLLAAAASGDPELVGALDRLSAGRHPLPQREARIRHALATSPTVELRRLQAELLRVQGDADEARRQLSALLDDDDHPPGPRARLLMTLGAALHQLGDPRAAAVYGDAHDALIATQQPALAAGVRSNLALLSAHGVDDIVHVTDRFLQARSAHRDAGDRWMEAVTLSNLGAICAESGRDGDARAHYRAALDVLHDLGYPQLEARVQHNLANLDLEAGRWHDAVDTLNSVLILLDRLGDEPSVGTTRLSLGVAYMVGQRPDEAETQLRAAIDPGSAVSAVIRAYARANLGLLRRLSGHDREAKTYFDGALAALDDTDPMRPLILGHAACLMVDLGDHSGVDDATTALSDSELDGAQALLIALRGHRALPDQRLAHDTLAMLHNEAGTAATLAARILRRRLPPTTPPHVAPDQA